ncbi:NAD-P-binding protein [Trametes versicolor FP-101664 SS1]|uniref:NAD-P-binding protein n=1 Tax=Trametes versicolor (strain FP-101664) TaxID=717944 RepID=UPI0004624806|nr:NAD-P-binding protein [Trametes versicolor FP-101664 SS1]EIW57263.1 NAD-P-binding protein [Trametes versicolor FP-101664 SS1]
MPSGKVSIFFTGATGYIGGSILQRLLARPDRENFEITALVRKPVLARRLEAEFGVKTVIGSLQDLDKLATLSENAHVVIQLADCDDVDALKAILSGLKARHEKTGDIPLLIHTSGTGVITDDAQGAYLSPKIYSDLDIASIEALAPTALHRPVDLLIVEADTAGYVRTHIILPSIVFGIATGPLFDAGIANPHTVFFPLLIRAALKAGNVGVLGTGAPIWNCVHVDDQADMYVLMLDALLNSPEKVSHGREGFFFGENGELVTGEIVKAIAKALFSLGRISSPELVQQSPEELGKLYGSEMLVRAFFANSRSKAERARREFGWAPTHTAEDFYEGIGHEVEVLVKREEAKK